MSRREVIAALGVAPFAAFATSGSTQERESAFAGVARGRVWAATGNAAAMIAPAAGLAGVMVSNGRDVTVTNSAGEWQLPARPGDMLFVIKPKNWTYVEEAGVPTFSHRFELAEAGSAASIDFHLRPQAEPDHFDVLLLADTQAADAQELDYVRKEISQGLQGVPAAFAINHGDIMGDDLSLLESYRAFLSSTGLQWHHCPGNHDLDLDAVSSHTAFDTWQRIIGPAHYAFQHAGATFIVLNNVDYFGKGARPVEGRMYRGQIGSEQLAFVANVLKHVPHDDLVVVSMHIPLVSFEDPDCAADNTADRRELMALLSGRPNTVSFSGHSHTTEHHYLGREQGYLGASPHHHHVLTAFCGAWWGGPLNGRGVPVADSRDGSPRGFHILSVRGQSYETRFVPMGDAVHPQFRLSVSAGAEDLHASGRAVVVDVFDGGPRTRIRCERADGMQTLSLRRAAIADPHIVANYREHRALMRPWVAPARSSHIWAAELPESEEGREHDYVVHILNEYAVETVVRVKV